MSDLRVAQQQSLVRKCGDNQLGNHLNDYYDEVIAVIRDADAIQIFGPGEAKGELEKRLETAGVKTQNPRS